LLSTGRSQIAADQSATVSNDKSPTYFRGVADYPSRARITFDKFHVISPCLAVLDQTSAPNSVAAWRIARSFIPTNPPAG
jgi:hypothetical protein